MRKVLLLAAIILLVVAVGATFQKRYRQPPISKDVAGYILPERIEIEKDRFIPTFVRLQSGQEMEFFNSDDRTYVLILEGDAPGSSPVTIGEIDHGEIINYRPSYRGGFIYYDRDNPQIKGQILVE